jgi:hypothetical protein
MRQSTRLRKVLHRLIWLALLALVVDPSAGLGQTATARAESASGSVYLNLDTATMGNWVGVYGTEGYVLPYFAVTVASGRQTPPPADVALLPPYVTSYSIMTGGSYWVTQNPSTNVSALQTPDKTSRKDLAPYTYSQNFDWKFDLNDANEHYFSVYNWVTAKRVLTEQSFEIWGLDGQKLAESPVIKDLTKGVYASFKVKGSFILRAVAHNSTDPSVRQSSVRGFFFDSLPGNTLSNVRLTNPQGRDVQIAWDNTDPTQQVSILRKKVGGDDAEIAVVAGANSYLDRNLEPGATYIYKLRVVHNHHYSVPTQEASITLPAYTSTALTFLDGDLTVEVGRQANVRVKLETVTNSVRSPLAGRTVSFKLIGENVGQYIPADLGSAETDANGVAQLSYLTRYSGPFQIQASFPYDDLNRLAAASSLISLTVNPKPWTVPPTLLRISDAVKPGELFTIYGEGMRGNGLQISLAEANGNSPPAVPPAGAFSVTPVVVDSAGHFASAVLPTTREAGTYHVWVKNPYGWSKPILLNGARPQWLSEESIFAGLTLKLVGRNLDGREWGAKEKTKVRLVKDGQTYEVQVKSVNPFAITFTVSDDVPTGTYDVLASSDGHHWEKLAYSEEYHQRLTVASPSPDPLGLGVAWVNKLNWQRQVNVLDYGAVPNDGGDDTAAIQRAIDEVGAQSGGVVYLPNGNYRFTGITLASGVVLLGQSKQQTILTYAYTGQDVTSRRAISSAMNAQGESQGKQGVARLTLTLDRENPAQVYPDTFIWLGDDWGARVQDENLRKAEYLFLTELRMDYPMEKRAGRGLGVVVVARGHLLLKNSDFKGYVATTSSLYSSRYNQFLANTFDTIGARLTSVGIFDIQEGNRMIRHPDQAVGLDTQGIFTRGPSYIANNSTENLGTAGQNDGEAYCVESFRGQTKMIGGVLTAEEQSVTVAPKWVTLNSWEDQSWDPWDINHHNWAGWHIVITDGRGLGQDRLLVSRNGNSYGLDKPWDIIPDGTSKFAVLVPIKGTTFYHNTVKNAAKGYWFYNDTIDGVMADNTSENAEGFFINTYTVESPQSKDYRFTIGYFDRIVRNSMTGVGTKAHVAGIGVRTAGGDYAFNVYGIDIKSNSITGILPAPAPGHETEAPDINGIYALNIGHHNMQAVQIENNTLRTLDRGITLGDPRESGTPDSSIAGVVMKNNTFENVEQQLIDRRTNP